MTPLSFFNSYRIYLREYVNADMLSAYDFQIEDYLRNHLVTKKPITIVITSNGGNTLVARALHDRIRLLNSIIEINIVAIGDCSSAAITILIALPRPQRYATRNTYFLMHEVSRGKRDMSGGTLRQFDLELEQTQLEREWLERDSATLCKLLARACNKTTAEVKRIWEPGTRLDAKMAHEFGLIGGILG